MIFMDDSSLVGSLPLCTLKGGDFMTLSVSRSSVMLNGRMTDELEIWKKAVV